MKVDFSETQLDGISSTGGHNVQLIYDNITDVLNGPITVNIRCNQSIWTYVSNEIQVQCISIVTVLPNNNKKLSV
jgi:hypothetical protein